MFFKITNILFVFFVTSSAVSLETVLSRNSVITNASTSNCKSCLSSSITINDKSEGTKGFTSDTIDTSGFCATRTFVCDANYRSTEVNIEFNGGRNGNDVGFGSVTSVLICNTSGQWTKQELPISEIECRAADTNSL